jgi:polysaccharide pyruvyl transferase WcaK-like protein
MGYRLVIKGGYGLTNFGDDALMYVLALNLKEYFEEDEIAFACYKNKYNKFFSCGFKIEPVENYKFIKTELLVFGGGTQFYSFLPERTKARKVLSKIKLFLVRPGQACKVNLENGYGNVAAIGVGVGPFLEKADPLAEINAKEVFLEMGFIAVRDISSMSKISEWNVKNVGLYSDICYLLDTEIYKNHKKSNVKSIGIVVRDWNHTGEGRSYYNKIELLVEKLNNQGYKVTLIIFAKKADKYWYTKKKNFLNVLMWDADNTTISRFMDKLSSFDLFLTARYHGAVFATLLNIPFLSIIVEQKLALISDIYDKCSEKWEYPFDVNDCINKIGAINNNYIEYINNINDTTIIQQIKAKEMLNDFIEYCKINDITKKSKE